MRNLKFPHVDSFMVKAEEDMETTEPMVDTSRFTGDFEVTPEVEAFIEAHKLSEDLDMSGEGEAKTAKLKPAVAEKLAKTSNTFKSREYAEERLEGMEESIKSMILEIGKEVSKDFEFAVDVYMQDSNYGNPAYSYEVKLSKGSTEQELSILYYTYEPGIAIGEAAGSWDWAAWLGLEESPFYDDSFSDDYDYDQMSIAMDEMLATFKESQDYWDVKDAIKKLEAEYVPTFTYHIDHDERGEFRAHVEDEKGQQVYQIQNNEEGEIEQIEDGFMRHTTDVEGLERYLQQMDIMPKKSELVEAE